MLNLFKVKAYWKQIEKQVHLIVNKKYYNKAKTFFLKIKLQTCMYEIQKFWENLVQFEVTIGSLSFRQPI